MEGNSMSHLRTRIALGAAATHLCLVVTTGVLQLRLPENWVTWPIRTYSALSGANSGYDYFASGSRSMLWATFDVVDAEGNVTTDHLSAGMNREVDLRIKNIVEQFAVQKHSAVKRALAASFAGKMFGKHPEAESIVVRLQQYHLPLMEEFQRGEQPGWRFVYEARFVRSSKLSAVQPAKGNVP